MHKRIYFWKWNYIFTVFLRNCHHRFNVAVKRRSENLWTEFYDTRLRNVKFVVKFKRLCWSSLIGWTAFLLSPCSGVGFLDMIISCRLYLQLQQGFQLLRHRFRHFYERRKSSTWMGAWWEPQRPHDVASNRLHNIKDLIIIWQSDIFLHALKSFLYLILVYV